MGKNKSPRGRLASSWAGSPTLTGLKSRQGYQDALDASCPRYPSWIAQAIRRLKMGSENRQLPNDLPRIAQCFVSILLGQPIISRRCILCAMTCQPRLVLDLGFSAAHAPNPCCRTRDSPCKKPTLMPNTGTDQQLEVMQKFGTLPRDPTAAV